MRTTVKPSRPGAGTRHVAVWGHGPKPAEIAIRGASFWGALSHALLWENTGTVSMGDSRIVAWDAARQPAVVIEKGEAILHDNAFAVRKDRLGVAIRIGPGADRVLAHHNQLNGHRVENQGTRTVVEGNQ